MQIPIYSKLKAKLESKGIDNISSGQIAWFVCSLVLALVTFLIVYFTGIVKNGDNLFLAIFKLFQWRLFIFIIYFCIPFNLLYIYNAIPLVLSAVFIFLAFYFSSLSLFIVVCCGIGVFFLISIFKRKLMFSVLLFAMGYTCTYLFFYGLATYH
ncbi:hypothetical protein [Campylobacter cuniculorum]|uniref:Yip1 domain-containing protein n=2 Tax=Campylobacter cuniculorum TaxID=374106 RepID=A0A1W6BVH8_9BACT|nr:hypothetical protein [Campylobacter cuniculorum]ARJ56096.1 hypothetical protein CCUN_0449 [Campylobacter cuniculorum DSM 23162 = LMG 24588]QOR03586.1 hypothetical protein A0071_05120 [Campylobacter cuniculorum]